MARPASVASEHFHSGAETVARKGGKRRRGSRADGCFASLIGKRRATHDDSPLSPTPSGRHDDGGGAAVAGSSSLVPAKGDDEEATHSEADFGEGSGRGMSRTLSTRFSKYRRRQDVSPQETPPKPAKKGRKDGLRIWEQEQAEKQRRLAAESRIKSTWWRHDSHVKKKQLSEEAMRSSDGRLSTQPQAESAGAAVISSRTGTHASANLRVPCQIPVRADPTPLTSNTFKKRLFGKRVVQKSDTGSDLEDGKSGRMSRGSLSRSSSFKRIFGKPKDVNHHHQKERRVSEEQPKPPFIQRISSGKSSDKTTGSSSFETVKPDELNGIPSTLTLSPPTTPPLSKCQSREATLEEPSVDREDGRISQLDAITEERSDNGSTSTMRQRNTDGVEVDSSDNEHPSAAIHLDEDSGKQKVEDIALTSETKHVKEENDTHTERDGADSPDVSRPPLNVQDMVHQQLHQPTPSSSSAASAGCEADEVAQSCDSDQKSQQQKKQEEVTVDAHTLPYQPGVSTDDNISVENQRQLSEEAIEIESQNMLPCGTPDQHRSPQTSPSPQQDHADHSLRTGAAGPSRRRPSEESITRPRVRPEQGGTGRRPSSSRASTAQSAARTTTRPPARSTPSTARTAQPIARTTRPTGRTGQQPTTRTTRTPPTRTARNAGATTPTTAARPTQASARRTQTTTRAGQTTGRTTTQTTAQTGRGVSGGPAASGTGRRSRGPRTSILEEMGLGRGRRSARGDRGEEQGAGSSGRGR